jgi:2-alkyl-3-oxoalkanoate reductase
VRAFVRNRDSGLDALGIEQVVGDITDPLAVANLVAGTDVVFHTAAIAGIWGQWDDYYRTNTLGTYNVTLQCQSKRVPRFVFTSSPSVTFRGKEQIFEDEGAPYATRWLCHYPHSKALAEEHVLQAHGVQGVATCALRPHLIWGPGDRHLIPRLLDRARQGRLVRVGSGKNLIDTIYIDNAVLAHIQAAEQLSIDAPHGGKAYFLSQGEPVNCWDWIGEVLTRSKVSPPRKAISYSAAWYLGYLLECVHSTFRLAGEPRMTRFLAAQLAKSHYFNISAARRDFGYSPVVPLEDAMRSITG